MTESHSTGYGAASRHLHKPKSWRGPCCQTRSFNATFDETATSPNDIILDLKDGTAT